MVDKKKLMKRLQVCAFTLNETALFLDTHPNDQTALEFFSKHQKMYLETEREFVENYGPLTHMSYNGEPRWNWIDEPWPWENDKEEM